MVAGICFLGFACSFLGLSSLVFRQLLLLVLLGLFLFGQLLFALFLFFVAFFLQALFFLLLQAVAAFFFLALTLALFAQLLLLAGFLFLLQALLLALDGDVRLPCVGRLGRTHGGGRGRGRGDLLHRRWWRGRWGLHSARRSLGGHGGPQLSFYGGLVGRVLPVHTPGQRADQHCMHQHRQRDGAQARRWTGRGKLVAVGVGVHGRLSGAGRVRFNRLA
ncbi:hypothetical protein ASC83_14285 [Acidovorax sp. Root402]|nr:hypothetical protein ASC83_14285 [Acidovorax sp. Root402]